MTDIRVQGPPDHVMQIVQLIETVVSTYDRSNPYNRDDGSGDIAIYLKVREANQAYVTRPGDDQIIEYCRTWRTKAAVMHYFGVEYDAVNEMLDRLHNGDMLARRLRDRRYEYVDAAKISDCATCEYCGPDADQDLHCWYGRGQGKIDEPRICDKYSRRRE